MKKSNKVMWDYVTLNVFIYLFGGVKKTADAAGMSLEALQMRLNNRKDFNLQEMQTLIRVLSIPAQCVEAAFFTAAG